MLRKIAKILYLVGGIISVVSVPSLFVTAVFCIVCCFSPNALSYVRDWLIQMYPVVNQIPAEPAYMTAVLIVCAVSMIISAGIILTNGILSFKAMNGASKPLAITTIVFGILSDVGFSIAGGVLSIIAHVREKRNVI